GSQVDVERNPEERQPRAAAAGGCPTEGRPTHRRADQPGTRATEPCRHHSERHDVREFTIPAGGATFGGRLNAMGLPVVNQRKSIGGAEPMMQFRIMGAPNVLAFLFRLELTASAESPHAAML